MTSIGSSFAAGASAGIGLSPPSPPDWAAEVMRWASPDGLILHAARPVLAAGLRQSGAGTGTDWGQSLQRILDDPRSVASFQAGMRQGIFEGGKSLVEGVWSLAKTAYNAGPAGWLVEGAQRIGVLGEVPSWAPDASRVTDQGAAIGGAITGYMREVAHDPAKLGNDVKGWIAANWDGLKADHAAAAARGPAAEAEWWGKITGRATFEVAAMVVPVSKFATVAKAGEALNLAARAGTIGKTFAEAAKAGKLDTLFTAARHAGRTAELVAEARAAGRLPELVAAARKAPDGVGALARAGRLTLGDIAGLQKSGGISGVEATTARRAVASSALQTMLQRAPAAKAEVDALADSIAGAFGGRVAKAPVKSEGRAIEKIMADYAGDAGRIKDLVRNTIIVDAKDIGRVVSRLEAAGAKVKTVAAAGDPLGYSGINATIVTKSGLTAEIQVNTAKMIFAKESAGNARAILGDATYQAIAREAGVPGGRGHELYEQWRALPPDSAQAKAIAAESRAYYAHFR